MELSFLAGRAWKFGNDIDTDAIIPGRYLVINDSRELAAHLFEGVRPEMAKMVAQGDYDNNDDEEMAAVGPETETPSGAGPSSGV